MFKTLLMVSTAATALLGVEARAASFGYTGAEQTYDITTTGVYDFTAAGGSGGSGYFAVGGLGARVGGMVTLTSGSVLDIFVAGAGSVGSTLYGGRGGGGGGGTFVFLQPSGGGPLTADTALIVAGGGGGASGFIDGGVSATGMGGNGQGGPAGTGVVVTGGGGAGVSSNGGAGYTYGGSSVDQGGSSPSNGGAGGSGVFVGGNGGFGGGGGGYGGGGGGGGFTGGYGGSLTGDDTATDQSGGGAGTSYLRDGATLVSQGLNNSSDGNGSFDITLAPAVSAAPEPATWLTMMLGLGGAGMMLRRRKSRGLLRTV